MLAGALSRQLGAPNFELRPRDPWPEDYEQMVAWASRLRESGAVPPLAAPLPDLTGTGEIYLGFPIWGMDLPAVTASFLRGQDLRGRTVRPFVTHGGYGAGEALTTLKRLAPGARIEDAFVLKCDQERDTLNSLAGWSGWKG